MKRLSAMAAMLSTTLALGACATGGGLSDAQQLALYRDHAGEPVPSFNYFGSINGWTPLGDTAIAVWTRPREAWLLELHGPCSGLQSTPAIALTNTMNRVSARFDKVLVRDTGSSMDMPCTIREIRPLDVNAIRAAEKQAREQPEATPPATNPDAGKPPAT